MYLATVAYSGYKSNHESGGGRRGAGLQRCLCTVTEFLESFSGIAKIVETANLQFDGLAFGTIMLLGSVAVNK